MQQPSLLPIALILILLVFLLFNFTGAFLRQTNEAVRSQMSYQFGLLKMKFLMVLVLSGLVFGLLLMVGNKLELRFPLKAASTMKSLNIAQVNPNFSEDKSSSLDQTKVIKVESNLFLVKDNIRYKMVDKLKQRYDDLVGRPTWKYNGRVYYLINPTVVSDGEV